MKFVRTVVAVLVLALSAFPQQPPKSATVPVTLDHNRIVIDVYLPLPDGTSKRVRAWVDSGNSEMTMSQRIAALLGFVSCDGRVCNATPPREIVIGGMKISLPGVRTASAPLTADKASDVMDPGMSAEINLPSAVLDNYDVVFDYQNREFTIGEPGTAQFKGKPTKVLIDAAGLIQIPSQIEGQSYNLALDTGASISSVSSDLLTVWHKAEPTWPFMTGAVGAANVWGSPEEARGGVLRLPNIQLGTTTLRDVAVAPFAPDRLKLFEHRAGMPTIGLVGGNVLRQYLVGIDYAHSVVYLQRTSVTSPPDMDGIGLTLRPELDGRYTVAGVVELDGKPSVPDVTSGDVLLAVDGAPVPGATMGQVWSLLGGSPGQTRSLTFERAGRRFKVDATVHRFLAARSKARPPVKTVRKEPTKK